MEDFKDTGVMIYGAPVWVDVLGHHDGDATADKVQDYLRNLIKQSYLEKEKEVPQIQEEGEKNTSVDQEYVEGLETIILAMLKRKYKESN